MTIEDALEAIRAYKAGEWDNPTLIEVGILLPDGEANIRHIKENCLINYGYSVGIRNQKLNTDYPGKFMVAECHEASELPTVDGRNGPWCIVGDDLNKLIDEAFDVLINMCSAA